MANHPRVTKYSGVENEGECLEIRQKAIALIRMMLFYDG